MMRKTNEKSITLPYIEKYLSYLRQEERSIATIEKYQRDIQKFMYYAKQQNITKELTVAYKEFLRRFYKPTSVNSMLAAINGFFSYLGWNECRVKRLTIQRKVFCDQQQELSKEEYRRLLAASQEKKQERINLIIQTICGTGIRVSELPYITAEAIRNRKATVDCKGKVRMVFLSKKLCRLLARYCSRQGINNGPVFVSRTGTSLNRSNIWRDMKALCTAANVASEKVFPHNLRHLFARTFYGMDKDIARLADILGHSNIETTRIYILSSGFEHNRQVERLGLII